MSAIGGFVMSRKYEKVKALLPIVKELVDKSYGNSIIFVNDA